MATFCELYGSFFDKYDDLLQGEIGAEEVLRLYQDVRYPGVRLAQIEAALEHIYNEPCSSVERCDFEEMLAELDRRFFLLKDLTWEFKVLAKANGLISEADARILFQSAHDSKFSSSRFDKWLSSRTVRGAGISFNEIDVLLCNVPKVEDMLKDLQDENKRKISHQVSFEKERRKMALLGRSATTVITDRTKSHDKKKKIEKLTYLKKLQEIKAKRTNNLQQRKDVEEGFKINKQKNEDQRLKEEEEAKRLRKEQEQEEEILRQKRELEEEWLRKEAELEEKRRREEEERRKLENEQERAEREKEEEMRRVEEEQQRIEEEAAELQAEQDEAARLAAEEEKAEEARRLEEEANRISDEAQRVEDEKRAEEAVKRSKEEAERSKEDEERRKREEELAAATEADRLALEELQKEGDKATRNVLLAQREEDMALRDLKEAEDALKAAKNAEDMARIKEASERKAAEDVKVKAARMNKRLAKAIQQRDLAELEPVLKEAKAKKIPGTEELQKEAEELVKLLYAGLNLENGVRDRSIEDIERAIEKIRAGGFEVIYAKELIEAELLLKKLKRLEFLKRQVMELKQQTIAELKSYQKPPPIVKHVMTTTFLILGHQAKDLKQWNQLVVLMGKTGKEGLKRRVQGFEPDNMPHEVAEICAAILEGLDTGTVADVSAGAAAFFVWCDGMIEERLSLPKVISKEMKETRRASLKREESNASLMRGGTVEVVSRRSRSSTGVAKPSSSKSDKSAEARRVQSKSPAVRKRK